MHEDIGTRLRSIIEEKRQTGDTVRSIARKAEVPYYRVWSWITGRTVILDVTIAEKLWLTLTGKPFA